MGEVISAINAKPENVQQFLTNSYVIPDYQRPYSWDKEQCSKLWEDITDFFENQNEEDSPYFLGNVVVYNENKKRIVVDGQQRLITLNLLVKSYLKINYLLLPSVVSTQTISNGNHCIQQNQRTSEF